MSDHRLPPPSIPRLAELARLALTPAEREAMAEQLASLVEHMAALRRVDLAEAPPSLPGERVRLREDRVRFDPLALPPAALAPDWDESFFRVPRLPALDPDAPRAEDGEGSG